MTASACEPGHRSTAAAWISVAVAAVLMFGGPAARRAEACSCVAGGTDQAAFDRSDAVFVGQVADYAPPPQRETMSSADPATWTFEVSEVYKGEVAPTQEVVSEVSGASCGLEIPHHGEFLVFAETESPMDGRDGQYVGDGQFYAGLCGGTRSTGEGPLEVAVTPHLPDAATEASSPSPTAPDKSTGKNAAMVVAAVAVVLVGGGGLMARASQHNRRPKLPKHT